MGVDCVRRGGRLYGQATRGTTRVVMNMDGAGREG
jgi:hypothetical protein